LLADKMHQNVLSGFGARLVRDRFSLQAAAKKQLYVYEQSLREASSSAAGAASFTTSVQRFSSYYARRKLARMLGQRRAEDFNAQPVAADTSTSNRSSRTKNTDRGALVYLAGAPWHAITGTDVQLARAMGKHRPVIWVDPPVSIISRIRRGLDVPTVSEVAPGVTRLHTIAPPGVTRPGVRTISRWWSHALVQHYIRRSGRTIDAVLTSSPEPVLTPWRNRAVRRLYFATDDFVAGAQLLGISPRHANRARERNLAAADSVLAVSEPLASTLQRGDRQVVTFPNGCDVELYMDIEAVVPSATVSLPRPIAGVFGQLNERLDLSYLERLADAGENLLLVGPRYEATDDFRSRLDLLIARPNVQWLDRRPRAELPSLMKTLTVGLTPYIENEFNNASFPLKTLEYLAAGLPAVSTQLPATKLLDDRVVKTAATADQFAVVVRKTIDSVNEETARHCRAQATRYSWKARARDLEMIIAESMAVPA
jgi:glycosyltransferase involved in cell wall biosynthesis